MIAQGKRRPQSGQVQPWVCINFTSQALKGRYNGWRFDDF